MPLSAEFDQAKFKTAMASVPALLLRAMTQAFNDIGNDFVKRMWRERMTGRPGVFTRTGNLRRSLDKAVVGTDSLSKLTLLVFFKSTARAYAGVQEFGATIRAKKAYATLPGGPYLAIPLSSIKTPAGVARGGPRDFPGAFPFKAQSGKWYVGRRTGSGIEALFALRSEVTVPPRLGMQDLWRQNASNIVQRMNQAVAKALEGIK